MTAAVILAGGAGRRLGGNKPFHAVGGTPLIEAVIRRLKPQVDVLAVNIGGPDHPLAMPLSGLGLPTITDEIAQMGPLSGVLSALNWAQSLGEGRVVVTPCDMPFLPVGMVARLMGAPDADVVYLTGDRDHPLCALWSVTLIDRLRQALQSARGNGGLAVMRFLESVDTQTVALTDWAALRNVNSEDSLK